MIDYTTTDKLFRIWYSIYHIKIVFIQNVIQHEGFPFLPFINTVKSLK